MQYKDRHWRDFYYIKMALHGIYFENYISNMSILVTGDTEVS